MTYEYMTGDQRFASSRTDVLVYQTPPLEEDVTVAGPLTATLYVSTTGTDSDWDVKLIDVLLALVDKLIVLGILFPLRGEGFKHVGGNRGHAGAP